MALSRLLPWSCVLLLAACAPGTPTSTSGSPAPQASAAASLGANYFLVDGTPAPLSGKATLTAFSRGALSGNYGIAPLTIPQKYLLTVDVQLKDYVGDQPTFGTANVAKAEAKLGVDGVAYLVGATWTPEKPDGNTFELAVTNRHVTMKWVGPVKAANGTTYKIDALMTDVAVPF
jgi:hypothetical protein